MVGSVRFFDRISRSWSTSPPSTALSWQYLVEGASHLGQVTVGQRALLVDDSPVDVAIGVDPGSPVLRVAVQAGDHRTTLAASGEVAVQIRAWRDDGMGWDEVSEVVLPIIQLAGASEMLEPDRLEDLVADRMPQLRQVYLSPFAELRHEVERLPVARARRISRRATQVLASRTEDWLKVGASGVTPRVIESLVRDEQVDLYENRVAARLLDSLHIWLRERLQLYRDVDNFRQQHEVTGWWRQQDRLARLWGSQPPGEDLRERLTQRREAVEGLLLATTRFKAAPLYQGVPRQARVRWPIHVTNLLSDDPNYRAVRDVWFEWWRERGDAHTPDERRAAKLRQGSDFEESAWLTVVHAMKRLRGDDRSDESGPIHLEPTVATPWGKLTLTPEADEGDVAWRFSGGPAREELVVNALIIPLACELLAGAEGDVQQRLESLRAATHAPCTEMARIILYPGTSHDISRLKGNQSSMAHLVPLAEAGGLATGRTWIIPISPLDLESMERVERALRWMVIGSALLRYPATVSFPPQEQEALRQFGFLSVGEAREGVVVNGIASAHEEVKLRGLVRDRVRQLELRPRQVGLRDAEELDRACEELLATSAGLAQLAFCPVCSLMGRLAPRAAATFEGSCPSSSCGARWGLRHAPDTDGRVPYLWIGDGNTKAPAGEQLQRWLGRDVLAEPCQQPEVPYGAHVINPWNGACTAGESITAMCRRCQPVVHLVAKSQDAELIHPESGGGAKP
jgi:hypothetical protein